MTQDIQLNSLQFNTLSSFQLSLQKPGKFLGFLNEPILIAPPRIGTSRVVLLRDSHLLSDSLLFFRERRQLTSGHTRGFFSFFTPCAPPVNEDFH